MGGFTKLFSSIIDSTVWRESKETKIVWITILAKCDKFGIVECSLPGLADCAKVTLAECEEAMRVLMTPDPYSRTKDNEGRRLVEIDGGWRILNHAKYRDKFSKEERLEYQAAWQKEYRKRSKVGVRGSRREGKMAGASAAIADGFRAVSTPE